MVILLHRFDYSIRWERLCLTVTERPYGLMEEHGHEPNHARQDFTDGTVATEQRDNTLFPDYHTTIDLPASNARFDFVVP